MSFVYTHTVLQCFQKLNVAWLHTNHSPMVDYIEISVSFAIELTYYYKGRGLTQRCTIDGLGIYMHVL